MLAIRHEKKWILCKRHAICWVIQADKRWRTWHWSHPISARIFWTVNGAHEIPWRKTSVPGTRWTRRHQVQGVLKKGVRQKICVFFKTEMFLEYWDEARFTNNLKKCQEVFLFLHFYHIFCTYICQKLVAPKNSTSNIQWPSMMSGMAFLDESFTGSHGGWSAWTGAAGIDAVVAVVAVGYPQDTMKTASRFLALAWLHFHVEISLRNKKRLFQSVINAWIVEMVSQKPQLIKNPGHWYPLVIVTFQWKHHGVISA